METLIQELESFDKWRFKTNTTYLNSYNSKNKFKMALIRHKVSKISNLACEALIDGHGRVVWTNVKELSSISCSVSPGEKDSFGWLTGLLHCSKGTIVFG